VKGFIVFAMIFAVAVIGCTKQARPDNCGEGDAMASCWYATGCWDARCGEMNDNGVCFTSDGEENMKMACEKQSKGVFYFKCPCPHLNAIGGCENGQLSDRVVTTWIYGKGMTPDEYQKVCETSAYNTFINP
jgi:hypothetical protein